MGDTFSPTLVMQITAGYNSVNHPQEYLQPDATTVFQAGGFSARFTPNPGGILVPKIPGIHPSGFFDLNGGWGPIGPQRLYQISGSVNKQIGKHALSFGAADYHTWMYTNWAENDVYFNQQATWNPCGSMNGTTCVGVGGNSLASMLIGLPDSAGRQLGNSGVNLYSSISDIFAQDTWKITPKLSDELWGSLGLHNSDRRKQQPPVWIQYPYVTSGTFRKTIRICLPRLYRQGSYLIQKSNHYSGLH